MWCWCRWMASGGITRSVMGEEFAGDWERGSLGAEGMFPSYPSLTFPNHYTIVTGLYPEHSGLVANSFEDATTHAKYGMSDGKAVTDGSWYGGVPFVEFGGE